MSKISHGASTFTVNQFLNKHTLVPAVLAAWTGLSVYLDTHNKLKNHADLYDFWSGYGWNKGYSWNQVKYNRIKKSRWKSLKELFIHAPHNLFVSQGIAGVVTTYLLITRPDFQYGLKHLLKNNKLMTAAITYSYVCQLLHSARIFKCKDGPDARYNHYFFKVYHILNTYHYSMPINLCLLVSLLSQKNI